MVFGKIRNQRGAGAIGCLFLIAIVGAGIYAGFQFGIPRLRHSSFEDRINEALGNLKQQSAAEAQKQIIQFASDFDIVLTPAQVKVENAGSRLKIDVAYDKVIDLKVWQKTERFNLRREAGP